MAGYRDMKMKIDKSAGTQLCNMAYMFPENWKEESRALMGLNYVSTESSLDLIKVEYSVKKQLLGGVYSLVFKGLKVDVSFEDDACELQYKGRFLKGEAYFTSNNGRGEIAALLNNDAELIEILSSLDIILMKVSCRNNELDISISPMGGAYTYTVFPPVKHGAVLPLEEMNRIEKVLNRIADSFLVEGRKKVAGAE